MSLTRSARSSSLSSPDFILPAQRRISLLSYCSCCMWFFFFLRELDQACWHQRAFFNELHVKCIYIACFTASSSHAVTFHTGFQPWCWLLSGCWKEDVRCGQENVRRISDLLIFWLFCALISNSIEVVCLTGLCFRASPALNLIIPGPSESSSSWEGTYLFASSLNTTYTFRQQHKPERSIHLFCPTSLSAGKTSHHTIAGETGAAHWCQNSHTGTGCGTCLAVWPAHTQGQDFGRGNPPDKGHIFLAFSSWKTFFQPSLVGVVTECLFSGGTQTT